MFGFGKKNKDSLIAESIKQADQLDKDCKELEFKAKVATAELNANHSLIDPELLKAPKEEKPKEEWIWVDGYKALYADMRAKYGDITYEIGKEVEVEEGTEIKLCRGGFHFCLKLEHLKHYYSYGRIFKVRAEVLKSEYEKFGPDGTYREHRKEWHPVLGYMPDHSTIDKLTARKIVLIEEITDYDVIKETFPAYHPFVRNEENWWDYINFCGSKGRDGDPAREYNRQMFVKYMRAAGFSEIIAIKLHDDLKRGYPKAEQIYDFVMALGEMNISPDMKLYLTIEEVKKHCREW